MQKGEKVVAITWGVPIPEEFIDKAQLDTGYAVQWVLWESSCLIQPDPRIPTIYPHERVYLVSHGGDFRWGLDTHNLPTWVPRPPTGWNKEALQAYEQATNEKEEDAEG